jgi:hypothetical protein
VCVGPSITEVSSVPGRTFLGYNVYGEVPGRAYAKARITEFCNHRGDTELNLGIVLRNLCRGQVPKAERRRRLFPNTNYYGLGLGEIAAGLQRVIALAKKLRIQAIDIAPSHYHIYHLNRSFGAVLDESHPAHARDLALIEHIEAELDREGIGMSAGRVTASFFLERAWYVADGKATDPATGRSGLHWPKPRQVVGVR